MKANELSIGSQIKFANDPMKVSDISRGLIQISFINRKGGYLFPFDLIDEFILSGLIKESNEN